MSSINRTSKIKSLFALIKKQIREAPKIRVQNALEALVYSACLENATFEQADGAFSVLEYHFIDWNEVRVSTAKELADIFYHLPDPLAAGDRVRKALQAVFETTYMFDLEEWKKKPLSQVVDLLNELPHCTPFMINYTIQMAFGGHVIALDESALRIFRLLGLAQTNKDNTKEEVSGLERIISKQDGPEFATRLHQFAVAFFRHEDPNELRAILKELDPQVRKRDWTAPVLQTIKPTKPEKPKPVATPSLPDTTTLDEEETLEDETVAVEEVAFLPNPITGEDAPHAEGKSDKTGKSETGDSTKSVVTPSEKATAARKPSGKRASKKPETKTSATPQKKIQDSGDKKTETEKSKRKEVNKGVKKEMNDVERTEKAKPEKKRKPEKAEKESKRKSSRKTEQKPKQKSSPLPGNETPPKSPMRKLRQKKPK